MRKIIIILWVIGWGLGCQNLFAKVNQCIALKVIPWSLGRVKLDFEFESPLQQAPKSFITENPFRIVLDFEHMGLKIAEPEHFKRLNIALLKQYRLVHAQDRLRVLLDLNRPTYYTSHIHDRTYTIMIAGRNSQGIKPHAGIDITHHPILTKYKITKMAFRGMGKKSGRLIFDVNSTSIPVDVTQHGQEVILKFLSTDIPEYLLKRYDVKDFQTPLQWMIIKQKGSKGVVTLLNSGHYGYFAYQVDQQFMVDLFPLSEEEAKALKLKKQVFLGKRLSLNFQDIPVRAVLQLLANFTHTNMVISDSVTGHVTLRLEDVPWDQALNIILTTRALDKRHMGDVLLIAPAKEILDREKQEFDALEELKQATPLHQELLQINYAKAADIATLIKDKSNSLLSKRGTLSVDARTNSIWMQDIESKIQEIQEFVKKLDIPVQQVLIEARIVDVTKDFSEELGIRWGISRPTHLSGTIEGANQLAQGTAAASVTLADRLNVDLGAQSALGQPASIGLAVANLGQGILLDLELSALESEDKGEVIASPRLITASQQEAVIKSGEEIPYQQATSSGATAVSFKQAVLSLKVKPQITPDGRILMQLKINQDRPSTTLYNGVPAILTKEIETNVLVDNGQTIVLGGIYQRDLANNVIRVPFLGTLPWVGVLFKKTHLQSVNEELLIFITPKIITDTLSISAVAGEGKDVYK